LRAGIHDYVTDQVTANVRRVRETMQSTLQIVLDVKELLCMLSCLVIWFGMLLYHLCAISIRTGIVN
jgi:hypothetical protein